jgi:alkanesulfonate monooxygenase SsuD/methylene tetrahydromethanopterin reductase-like flavin-dependent oxidoreductase (luciferase family)
MWQAGSMPADIAFGISAAARADHARLGAELERLGYHELWVNDTRRGDGMATLAQAAPSTSSLRFGLGVIALSEHAPAAIEERISRASLPLDRLTVGVGAGASTSLKLVRAGVAELRRLLPDVPVAVAAVGPRMLHLAGEVADAVVATWALPDRVAEIRERVAEGADAAGHPPPRLVLYLRTAIGEGAESRLRAEMDRYAGSAHYARAFEAQSGRLVGIAVDGGGIREALEPYRSLVDTLVIRGLPVDDAVDAWLEIASMVAEASEFTPGGR